jgi:anthranilate phosphoribosyltransferase
VSASTWPDVLDELVGGRDLDAASTAWAMATILEGESTPAQIAAFAVALRAKGISQAELQGLVDALLSHAVLVDVPGRVVDIVGTGGDRAKTVNISSMSAVTAAAAGAQVVKHGNRAASSDSGTADVFEVLRIRLDVPTDAVPVVLERAGITFCFAPLFHPGLRFTGPPRREIGIATPFNILGPLVNPARPQATAAGCSDLRMAPLMARVYADRGDDAFVFRGEDGLDEITTTGPTRVWTASGGEVVEDVLDPRDLGFDLSAPEALRGGDPTYNADVFRRVLDGEVSPVRDAVLMNAGAALAAHAGGAAPLLERLADGVERARAAIDSGAARATLERWSTVTQELAPAR